MAAAPAERSAPASAVTQLDADYLVQGAGAMGMAFVDVLVTETKATVVLVDDRAQPGGHWNDAYPYVRLHQPSAFYGVNSRKLERSQDLLELASRNEILAYYERVLEEFIKSGRVRYFPKCRCDDPGSRTFRSLLDPNVVYEVSARAKIVNASYMEVIVPSVSHPAKAKRYEIDDGLDLVPLNDLVKVGTARKQYVVLGAGKSGFDAVLWLTNNGVEPDRITWVMPRDAWVVNREVFSIMQLENFGNKGYDLWDVVMPWRKADSVEECYNLMERIGLWTRLDPTVVPTRNKCATVTPGELQRLRSVKNILRHGRLRRIQRGLLLFASGVEVKTGEDALYVDCTADALARRPPVPVFQGDRITLQPVVTCQQVFSSAVIAHMEARGGSDAAKNRLLEPAPHPDTPEDFLTSALSWKRNQLKWRGDAEMRSWLWKSRLCQESTMIKTGKWWQLMKWTFTPKNFRQLATAEPEALRSLERIASKL